MAGVDDYSTTAASNTTVGGVSVAEGMSPASVNNAIRALMADIAAWAQDLSGGNTTGGSANAHTLTTSTGFTAYSDTMTLIGFTSGFTNTAAVTINVNTIGAQDLKKYTSAGLVALSPGDLQVGGRYLMMHEATNTDFILLNPSPKGGMGLISAQTAAGSSAIEFTSGLTSDFASFVLYCTDVVPATDGANMTLQFSTDGGSSYIATSYEWFYLSGGSSGTTVSGANSSGDTSMRISGAMGSQAAEGGNVEITFANLSNATRGKTVRWRAEQWNAAPILTYFEGAGGRAATTAAVNAFRVQMSSGNISLGNFRLYGIRGA